MARTTKYEWPNDQKLQALLDEHGTVETARQVGCPPSSLSNRIRKRGLRGAKVRRQSESAEANGTPEPAQANGTPEPAQANGTPEPAHGNGTPEPAQGNGTPEPAKADEESESGNPKPRTAGPSMRPPKEKPSEDSVAERTDARPQARSRPSPLEQLGSADYLIEAKPRSSGSAEAGSGNGDKADERSQSRPTSSVEPAPGPKRRRGGLLQRSPQAAGSLFRALGHAPRALRRVPGTLWRALAVVALAALAGIAAFISTANDPKTFQRESSVAVRPSPTVPPAAVNDVIGTLAQPDSAITETIVDMLGSPRLRTFAARSAGVPASSVGGSGAEYVWSATRRPGSTIIDLRLTGPSDAKLQAMQAAAAPEAARLVEGSYTPYRLETLSAPTAPVQVGPKTGRTIGLALMLGALLGITLLVLERKLRSSLGSAPTRAPAQRSEPQEH